MRDSGCFSGKSYTFPQRISTKGMVIMKSTYLVKYGSRPELLFRVTTDGKTYEKEISLVFPKYASADMPRYRQEYESEMENRKPGEMKCSFILEE
jgi:hypothetical protein